MVAEIRGKFWAYFDWPIYIKISKIVWWLRSVPSLWSFWMRQYLLFTLNRVKTNSTYSTWLFSPMRFALKEGVNRFLENPKYFNLVTPSFFISAQTGWTKSQRRWRRRRREAWWSTSGTPQVQWESHLTDN